MPNLPLRVLELRSVRGTGGGPEKTIFLGAAQSDPDAFQVTVCYIRDRRDDVFALDSRAKSLGVDYVEVPEGHSFDPAIWKPLCDLVRRRSIDIVHAHDYKTNLLALLLAAREGVTPLATAHGWTGHSRRERYIYYPADRRLLRRFPRVIAVSTQIRQALTNAGANPTRVSVVLNAIDSDRFRRDHGRIAAARARFGWAAGEFVVGSVGRLEPQKRFDLLIEAVSRVHRFNPAARLMIAGDGSRRHELEALAARLLPPGVCVFLGHATDVDSVHHALDLFVQASDYEGTPNAVLEAMAFETPVVATNAGGTAELAVHEQHALIVPAGNVQPLVDAITLCIQRPDDTTRRVRAARARVEGDLSFKTRMRRVEQIYADLARERSRSPTAPVPEPT